VGWLIGWAAPGVVRPREPIGQAGDLGGRAAHEVLPRLTQLFQRRVCDRLSVMARMPGGGSAGLPGGGVAPPILKTSPASK
jgi:hypothetical protein